MARAGEVFAGATLTVEDDRQDYDNERERALYTPRF